MVRRLFPHPNLSLTLVILWLLLVNGLSLGQLLLATGLGTLIPLLTSVWWPDRPRIHRPFGLLAYGMLVLWDVVIANFQVARIILFLPRDRIRSAWVTVPLDLTSPEAISLLAGTITMTPGTLTADFSGDGRALLVHALHAPDPSALATLIKSRYEARLMRIME
ncbi:MAG: Na+/H+ antiporter subunit E [Tabrizicola sp.]|nr:Na+/H+ antiporter subunit E [Tabrizicola sp.]